jgi:hypothetical protein
MFISAIRAHLSQQITWGTRTTLMIMRRLRNPVFDAYFEWWAHAGSEGTFVVILLLMTWNVDMKMARSLAMLYGLNVYVTSFLKNLFCLPRPMGDMLDYGWPSVLSSVGVSVPFFLLHCRYGTVWFWESEAPLSTVGVYTAVLFAVGSMCATRLYFCSCSPADVQAGCIVGAIILRLWMVISLDVDNIVMGLELWWVFPAFAILLLVIHPVPSLVQINETYKFCIYSLGFLSGFLLGCTQPPILPHGRCAQDPTTCGYALRTFVGLCMLQSFLMALEYSYPRAIEAVVKATVGRQASVPMWGKKLLKIIGWFGTRHASGFIASWAIPRILEAMEM